MHQLENLDIDKHITMSFGYDVRSIAQPFMEQYGLTHFCYARNYKDRTRFGLTTDPEMMADYYNHKFYDVT